MYNVQVLQDMWVKYYNKHRSNVAYNIFLYLLKIIYICLTFKEIFQLRITFYSFKYNGLLRNTFFKEKLQNVHIQIGI